MIEPKVGDEVRVSWDDPNHKYEVETPDASDHSPAPVVSYGKVVRVDSGWFYLAHEWMKEDNQYALRGVTVIHTCLVTEYLPMIFREPFKPGRLEQTVV
jgi:hypothetical protein